MAVRYSPACASGFGLCILIDIEVWVIIDLPDESKYVLEQFLFGHSLLARLVESFLDF